MARLFTRVTIHRQASLVQKVTIEIRLPLNSLRVGLPYTHVKYAAVPPNASAADQPRQEHPDSVVHLSILISPRYESHKAAAPALRRDNANYRNSGVT